MFREYITAAYATLKASADIELATDCSRLGSRPMLELCLNMR